MFSNLMSFTCLMRDDAVFESSSNVLSTASCNSFSIALFNAETTSFTFAPFSFAALILSSYDFLMVFNCFARPSSIIVSSALYSSLSAVRSFLLFSSFNCFASSAACLFFAAISSLCLFLASRSLRSNASFICFISFLVFPCAAKASLLSCLRPSISLSNGSGNESIQNLFIVDA